MTNLEEILEKIDKELLMYQPSTDEFKELLQRRETVMELIEKEKKPKKDKKTIDPNTIITSATALLQVTAVAVVGFLTRIDRDALHFIKKP